MSKSGSGKRRFFDDVGTALLALTLSVVVWVNATYQADRPIEGEFPAPIPIEFLNMPAGLMVTKEPVSSVTVRIKAFSSTMAKLSVSSFRATSDWKNLGEGEHSVRIKVTCSDPKVTILAVQPETITVALEYMAREAREVSVQLLDREELPLGYSADPPEIEPRFVTVEGPLSAIKRLSTLVALVSLKDQRAPIERQLEPRALDINGKPIPEIKLTPKTVTVRVDIKKKLNYREVTVRARTKGQPARGYFISSVNVEPSTVTVSGPPAVIANMPGLISIKGEVDVTGMTRMFAERRELDLPEGVSVLGEREGEKITRVLVTVEIDPVKGGTTVELPLQVRKLQSGLAVRLSVPAVDVILTGPAVLLDDLQTELLEAYVDLGGRGIGTHQVKTNVDIRISRNPKLADLVVTSISPEFVEAEIRDLSILTPVAPPGWIVPGLEIRPTPTLTATVAITRTVAVTTPTKAPTRVVPTATATVAPSPTPK